MKVRKLLTYLTVLLDEGGKETDLFFFSSGARSILRAFFRDDIPEDPNQIFLTSWGEWWPTDVYANSLDKDLQDKFCPSKEEIESQEKIE